MANEQEPIKSKTNIAPKRGVIRKVGGVARFMLWDTPKNMIGFEVLKTNTRYLAQQVEALKSPSCPHCNQSKLTLNMDADGVRETYENGQTQDFYHWDCGYCSHSFLLPLDHQEAKELAQEQRNLKVKEIIEDIPEDDLMEFAKVHQVNSRIYYLFSLISFLAFAYMLATGANLLPILATLSMCIALFTNGLTKAFRYWQAINRQVFVENSFQHWLRLWNWFV